MAKEILFLYIVDKIRSKLASKHIVGIWIKYTLDSPKVANGILSARRKAGNKCYRKNSKDNVSLSENSKDNVSVSGSNSSF